MAATKNARCFSGADDEDVELFIDHCRLLWVGPEYSEEKKNDAILETMLFCLRGQARKYADDLNKETREDWKKLAAALKGKYENPNFRVVHPGVIGRLVHLEQGNRKLEDHVKDFKELASFVGPQTEMMAVECFIQSLSDKVTQKFLHMHNTTLIEVGKKSTVDDIVKMALKWEQMDYDAELDKATQDFDKLFKPIGRISDDGSFIPKA